MPEMKVVVLDGDALEISAAEGLTKLASLRGLRGVKVRWDDGKKEYIANDVPCGRSVHGVYAWMDEEVKRASSTCL